MDSPSAELVRQLDRLTHCRSRDVERCRPLVKRLSRDLPTFDSVWIDALVQRGLLTRFQSTLLESNDPDRLKVGSWFLIDQLEPGQHCHTYHAQDAGKRQSAALKIFTRTDELPADLGLRFEALAAKLRDIPSTHLACPQSCLRLPTELVVVSPYIAGRTLQELLVRRGRFTARVVAEIGHQLVDALALLESKRVVHGDINLRTVKLNAAGQAVLVDVGIRPQLNFDFDLHTEVPLRQIEGVAPELIGTGQPASSRSDLYAVGCLLWQLLAGRPPFPTADPLSRIAAHRTQELVDVREWSPDTPAWLAELIRRFTERDPGERPASIREVARQWGSPARAGTRKLAQFEASFDEVVPLESTSSRFVMPTLVTGIMLAAGFGLWQLRDDSANPFLLSTKPAAATIESAERSAELPSAAFPPIGPLAVPAPSATGGVELQGRGPFQLKDVAFAGTLRIVGTGSEPAECVLSDSVRLSAAHIILKNIRIAAPRDKSVEHAVRLDCQTVTIDHCQFSAANQVRSFFDWEPDDPHDRSGVRLALRNTSFLGNCVALQFREPPRVVRMDNVLKAGRGGLMRFEKSPPAGRDSHIQLQKVTLNQTGSLLRLLSAPESRQQTGSILIRVVDCVFAPRQHSGAALLEIMSSQAPISNQPLIAIESPPKTDASLVALGIKDALWLDTSTRRARELDSGLTSIAGLMATGLTFRAGLLNTPAASVIHQFEAPRLSQALPGIDATQLPPVASESRPSE